MRTRIAIPRPVSRLLAALSTVCVLASTLGWTHPACGPSMAHGGTAVEAVHGDAPHAHQANERPCHRVQQQNATERPGDDGPHATDAACTSVVQCATLVLVTEAESPSAPAQPSLRPSAFGVALPPGPVHQPDSPPPKR